MDGGALRQQAAYWRETLADAPEPLELPTDRARPTQSEHARGNVGLVLEEELVAAPDALVKRRRADIPTMLLAGWAALSDQPFNAFVDVYTPNKWGSWGALRHLGDENPRWLALARGCDPC